MASNTYVAVGGTTGARLATRSPVSQSGVRWYVSSTTPGVDAAGYGTDRAKPFLTLANAVTNASAGDTIILLKNHIETLTAAQTLSKAGLKIYGEGLDYTEWPKFQCNAAIAMFDITARGVVLDSIYFPQAQSAAPTARVRVAQLGFRAYNLRFDCGALDTNRALSFITGAGQAVVENCSFVSTGTAIASQPAVGIEVLNAMNDLLLDTVVFDGGTVGWSSSALLCTSAVTGLEGLDVDLLNGSDANLGSSVYEFHVRNKTGSSRVVLP